MLRTLSAITLGLIIGAVLQTLFVVGYAPWADPASHPSDDTIRLMSSLAIAAVIAAGAPMVGITFVSTRMFGGSFRIAFAVEIVAFVALVYFAVAFISVTNDCDFGRGFPIKSQGVCR